MFLLYLFSVIKRLTLWHFAAAGRAVLILILISKGESQMPVVFIDAPRGIRTDAKRKMMEKITTAIDEAYQIGDTLVFLREHAIAMSRWTDGSRPKTRKFSKPSRRSAVEKATGRRFVYSEPEFLWPARERAAPGPVRPGRVPARA